MTITTVAICEAGSLRFKEPLALAEGTPVRVTITPVAEDYDPLEAVIGICKGGPPDGAEKHDKYLYGFRSSSSSTQAKKPRKPVATKQRRGARA